MSDHDKFLGYHDCYKDMIESLDDKIPWELCSKLFHEIDVRCAVRFPEIVGRNKKLSDEYKARLKRVEREKTND